MDAAALARSVQEGGNFLGVFLCTGALGALRERAGSPELNDLLVRGLATYAPAFRGMQAFAEGARDVEPSLERLDALTQLGVDFDAPREVADLRAAVRELLANAGFDLPGPVRGNGVACELHGASCPQLGGKAEPPPAPRRRRAAAASKRSRAAGRASAGGRKKQRRPRRPSRR